MRLLGIDPGSTATGFGVVEKDSAGLVHIAHGVLRPPRDAPLARRLAFLHAALLEVIEEHRPDRAAVERVFVSASPHSALVLGHARGVALAALAAHSLEVSEISAREVKKGVVGNGGASKSQVQTMVTRLLALESEPPSDAADALAIAICQIHAGPLAGLGLRGRRKRRRFTAEELGSRARS